MHCLLQHWITFQLLHAVAQCHERSVCHGDIKTENVLVTSWNWVFLTDFASYKPVRVPADHMVSLVLYGCKLVAVSFSAHPNVFYKPVRSTSLSGCWHITWVILVGITCLMVRRTFWHCDVVSYKPVRISADRCIVRWGALSQRPLHSMCLSHTCQGTVGVAGLLVEGKGPCCSCKT